MKPDNSSSERRPSRQSFRHSFSISSILRASSRSPEKPRAGKLISGPQNASRISFASSGSVTRSASEPVRAEEFADSDSSQNSTYSKEDAELAESLYSVIQEYDNERKSFWFDEEFDKSCENSLSDSTAQEDDSHEDHTRIERAQNRGSNTSGKELGTKNPFRTGPVANKSLVQAERRSVYTEGTSHSSGQVHRPQPTDESPWSKLPDPDISLTRGNFASPSAAQAPGFDSIEETEITPPNDTYMSLSSGELLARLDDRSRSNRMSAVSDASMANLTAEVVQRSELPVMLYTVHDRDNRSRWSVYETQRGLSPAPSSQPPTVGQSQMGRGNLRASHKLVSSSSTSSRTNMVRSHGQGGLSSTSAENDGTDASYGTAYGSRSSSGSNWHRVSGHGSSRDSQYRIQSSGSSHYNIRGSKVYTSSQGSGYSGSNAGFNSASNSASNSGSNSGSRPGSNRNSTAESIKPSSQISPAQHSGFNSAFHSGSQSLSRSSSRPGFSPANTSSVGVFSNLSEHPIHEDFGTAPPPGSKSSPEDGSEQPQREKQSLDPLQFKNNPPSVISYFSTPSASVTRDSTEKYHYHDKMFGEENLAFGQNVQQNVPSYMSWGKWLWMMITALVAVPVFFLLALGAFDHGGFSRDRGFTSTPSEKSTSVNWRYHKRYSRAQKVTSLILGIVWLAIVFAMLGVGLGKGLKH